MLAKFRNPELGQLSSIGPFWQVRTKFSNCFITKRNPFCRPVFVHFSITLPLSRKPNEFRRPSTRALTVLQLLVSQHGKQRVAKMSSHATELTRKSFVDR